MEEFIMKKTENNLVNKRKSVDKAPSNSVSNASSRYPLANNQTNVLQNINYKDYLRVTEAGDSKFLGNPETLISSSSVQTGIGIVSKILGTLGVPFAGAISGFYSFIVGLLWPSSTVSIWEMIMEQVEELVNQKITEHAREEALAKLRGLGDGLDVYQRSLENWLENRNNTRARSVVATQFIALELDFVSSIPSFAVGGQEVPLLATYAQAANLHLLLLRDASIFGEEWGFTSGEISTFYNRQMTCNEKYSDYCVKWYNIGLDKLKGTSAASWLKYHQFRRDMTLLVLDLVALFPSYDTRTYPIETTAQLTRDVYTDPLAFNKVTSSGFCNPWSTHSGVLFSEVESAVIRTPHLFDILSSVEIFTHRGKIALNNEAYLDYWIGHSLKYHHANNTSLFQSNYGRITSEKNYFTLEDSDIIEINSITANLANTYQKAYGVPESRFHMVNRDSLVTSDYLYSKTHTTLAGCTQNYKSSDEIPLDRTGTVVEGYSHRLSHITYHSFSKYSSKYYGSFPVFVWSHVSADLNNTIYADKITQIPLTKSDEINNNVEIVNSDYVGGSILKVIRGNLPNNSVNSIKFLLPLSESKRYEVRIRYASTGDGFMQMTNVTGNKRFSATMEEGSDLKYDSFRYITLGSLREPSINNYYSLYLPTPYGEKYTIYIDRIEIIPIS
ncbi:MULTISPECIES: insecticidal delta-endotoxin Cry8Ea1 family protein [unclassified Bacillus cereus group]|nr:MULTISPECIES: insecticidal delta-endotoxin Cry8Ea1 family protein [unclassified Bacillus cereus group]MEB9434363.1 insecticidal delta-endotoxin Cry8Ea1 family protein [Bacillus cereus]MEB9483519.1 insecticidal delta-endotoxin Cry8Ea1 family protein [Bacillus cereus]